MAGRQTFPPLNGTRLSTNPFDSPLLLLALIVASLLSSIPLVLCRIRLLGVGLIKSELPRTLPLNPVAPNGQQQPPARQSIGLHDSSKALSFSVAGVTEFRFSSISRLSSWRPLRRPLRRHLSGSRVHRSMVLDMICIHHIPPVIRRGWLPSAL